MTLITYLTRVHFADGVLEEALRSEIERHTRTRPLIIAEPDGLTGEIADRFFSSFPLRTSAETFVDVPALATEAAALEIQRLYTETDRDLLIAFGSARAIDLAKVARIAIAYDDPISTFSSNEGGSQRIRQLPTLFAVPGIQGFASAVSDYARVKLNRGGQVLLSSRNLYPTVTICDPTLTLGAAPSTSASAASGVISRGIEAYLSRGYNPPADGLALDGLARIARNVSIVLEHDDMTARREMMAGCLNSALSLQKGLCAVHAITNALASVSAVQIDPCAVGRLIMPGLVRHYGAGANGKMEMLRTCLGLDDRHDFPDALAEMMRGFPLPDHLSEMGVMREDLAAAARIASQDRAIGTGPRPVSEADVEAILSAAY
ncbi:iron-containing alcohol dehydrogenase [Rhodobacteraceae bacterium NNCM2]|nr:iron-containing alcohol dehydrogenase [Coraliihabitans acroporae]